MIGVSRDGLTRSSIWRGRGLPRSGPGTLFGQTRSSRVGRVQFRHWACFRMGSSYERWDFFYFWTLRLWDFRTCSRTVGLLNFLAFCLLDFGAFRLFEFWTLGFWDFGMLGLWDFYTFRLWDFGTLRLFDFWTLGVLDFSTVRPFDCWSLGLLDFLCF